MHDTQKESKILAKSILTTSTVNMFIQVGRSRLSREGGERESRRHTYGRERKGMKKQDLGKSPQKP